MLSDAYCQVDETIPHKFQLSKFQKLTSTNSIVGGPLFSLASTVDTALRSGPTSKEHPRYLQRLARLFTPPDPNLTQVPSVAFALDQCRSAAFVSGCEISQRRKGFSSHKGRDEKELS
jgi:hypothetical protein